jgi:hypothetical protein
MEDVHVLWVERMLQEPKLRKSLRKIKVQSYVMCSVDKEKWDQTALEKFSKPMVATKLEDKFQEEVRTAYRDLCLRTAMSKPSGTSDTLRGPIEPDSVEWDLDWAIAYSMAYARRVVEIAWVFQGDSKLLAEGLNQDGSLKQDISWIRDALLNMPCVESIVTLDLERPAKAEPIRPNPPQKVWWDNSFTRWINAIINDHIGSSRGEGQ